MTVSINGVYSPTFKNGVLVKETLNPANEAVNRGYYAATTLSAVDAELATVNIKNGITIFGFAGDADVHDISDATAVEAEVITGETFYAASGGIRTGTMPIVTLAPGSSAYPAGYHAGDGGGLPAIDADLVTGNIKFGITIFNVAGHTNVRDVSDADAVVGEVKTGSTFYAVGGAKKTGTGTKTLNPANEVVAAGYYAATTLSAVDIQLAVANIKLGVNIFGFVGTVAPGGVETIETFAVGALGHGAQYTPGSEGLYFWRCITRAVRVELFSTAETSWFRAVPVADEYEHIVVSDGTNVRFDNQGGAGISYIIFRHYLSSGTYERNKDDSLASMTTYTPAESGFWVASRGGPALALQKQVNVNGAWTDDQMSHTNLGDGTNYRLNNNHPAQADFYVLMRAVMT